MTDFKSAAEQQVREERDEILAKYPHWALRDVYKEIAVSKTAELMEMTAQRDEAQKALAEIVKFCMMESTPIAADIRAIHSTAKRALRGKQ